MRACSLICTICLTLLCTVADGADTSAHHTSVIADGADVRSGPGRQFYVTRRLAGGTPIEVYWRHDGGWLAIRPPPDSFSWVRNDQLELTSEPDVARVLNDDVVCRVGSSIVEVDEHVGQVHLKKDERVLILPAGSIATESARELERQGWSRIAPPAGEFRWIRAADVADPPHEGAVKAGSAVVFADGSGPGESGFGKDSRPLQPASAERPLAASEPSGDVVRVQGDTLSSHPSREAADASPVPPGTPPEVPQPAEQGPAADRAKPQWMPRGKVSASELLQVEQQLAVMVSREIAGWRLQPLRARVETVLPNLREASQRAQAKRLLERIAEFERLQNRFAQAGDGGMFSGSAHYTALGPRTTAPDSLLSRFDGSGWLVPVHSTRRTAPPYALLDAEGEVLQYVSPSPGLNLNRYVRRQVGIFGQRGQGTSLNKPHVTAERIVDLDRHLR